jgi:hypothetical protein
MTWEIAGKGTPFGASKLFRKKVRWSDENDPVALAIRWVAADTGEQKRACWMDAVPVNTDETAVVRSEVGRHCGKEG